MTDSAAKPDKKNTGRSYETEIKEVFTAIHRLKGLENVNIELNQELAGSTQKRDGNPILHEIDVSWEFKLDGKSYKTLIQGKDLVGRVKKLEMMGFERTVSDIPDSKGIFVTKTGFQSGALEWAIAKGIEAAELREPTTEELENRIRRVELTVVEMPRVFTGISNIRLNQDWLNKQSVQILSYLNRPLLAEAKKMRIFDSAAGVAEPFWTYALNAHKGSADFEGLYETQVTCTPPIMVEGITGVPFRIVIDGFFVHFTVGPITTKTIAIEASLTRILRSVTGTDSYIIAEINGDLHALKVNNLPPTKGTPSSNPKADGRDKLLTAF